MRTKIKFKDGLPPPGVHSALITNVRKLSGRRVELEFTILPPDLVIIPKHFDL
jgi:hypothetical protein